MAYRYQNGAGNVGSYQISGIPYATASFTVAPLGSAPTSLGFPQVTKFVTVINTNSGSNVPLRIGFSSLGITGSATVAADAHYYFILDNGQSYTGEWRVSTIYLLSDTVNTQTSASVVAGLAAIDPNTVPGKAVGTTNWSGSIGVG